MINIKINSKEVQPGDTFVAIKGNTVNGHNFIDEAIKNGAQKIIIEKDNEYIVEKQMVDDTKNWLNNYIVNTYKDTINEMKIIGITGTNGKTTTAYLTYQMLNNLRSKTAYIGTIGFYIPGEKYIDLPNTTPNILELYNLLLIAKEKKCENVVMEVSSHALVEKRVEGLLFNVAAFTNLSQDHLDYHKNMDNYLSAKLLILSQLNGPLILNNDNYYSQVWKDKYNNIINVGKNTNDYCIKKILNTKKGTKIKVKIYNKKYIINTNLKNEFNVYNYITAFAIAKELGFSEKEIINITKNVFPPKGRCEQIKTKKGNIIIDYAHTPDAVEKIISAFSKNTKGKIITIIGCGGNRDSKKRALMGQIASFYSDFVIFTNDNPRTENPQDIMRDILKGVNKSNYIVELNRKNAITKGLAMMKKNDVVLILGKGHENYQIIGKEKYHFDDKEEVINYLKQQKKN